MSTLVDPFDPPAGAVRLRGVRRGFDGRSVLRDISLDVAPGEVVLVCGPNGAGKTTLLRLIAGRLRPHAGEVSIPGAVGYLSQQPAFPPALRGGELLAAVAVASSPTASSRLTGDGPERVRAAAGLLGLEEHLPFPVGGWSGGMVRRLGLALLHLADPDVLLLDEPLDSLDAGALRGAVGLIREWRARGKVVLVATHQPGMFRDVADRLLSLRDGVIAQ